MVAISPSHGGFPSQLGQGWKAARERPSRSSNLRVSAKAAEKGEEKEDGRRKENKQSLFSSVTEALDFSQVRSSRDAELLDDARDTTKSGGRMTREQVYVGYKGFTIWSNLKIKTKLYQICTQLLKF